MSHDEPLLPVHQDSPPTSTSRGYAPVEATGTSASRTARAHDSYSSSWGEPLLASSPTAAEQRQDRSYPPSSTTVRGAHAQGVRWEASKLDWLALLAAVFVVCLWLAAATYLYLAQIRLPLNYFSTRFGGRLDDGNYNTLIQAAAGLTSAVIVVGLSVGFRNVLRNEMLAEAGISLPRYNMLAKLAIQKVVPGAALPTFATLGLFLLVNQWSTATQAAFGSATAEVSQTFVINASRAHLADLFYDLYAVRIGLGDVTAAVQEACSSLSAAGDPKVEYILGGARQRASSAEPLLAEGHAVQYARNLPPGSSRELRFVAEAFAVNTTCVDVTSTAEVISDSIRQNGDYISTVNITVPECSHKKVSDQSSWDTFLCHPQEIPPGLPVYLFTEGTSRVPNPVVFRCTSVFTSSLVDAIYDIESAVTTAGSAFGWEWRSESEYAKSLSHFLLSEYFERGSLGYRDARDCFQQLFPRTSPTAHDPPILVDDIISSGFAEAVVGTAIRALLVKIADDFNNKLNSVPSLSDGFAAFCSNRTLVPPEALVDVAYYGSLPTGADREILPYQHVPLDVRDQVIRIGPAGAQTAWVALPASLLTLLLVLVWAMRQHTGKLDLSDPVQVAVVALAASEPAFFGGGTGQFADPTKSTCLRIRYGAGARGATAGLDHLTFVDADSVAAKLERPVDGLEYV